MMEKARRGMKLGTIFRARYNLPQEIDIFKLLNEAIIVAKYENGTEFAEKKEQIISLLYTKNKVDDGGELSDVKCCNTNEGGSTVLTRISIKKEKSSEGETQPTKLEPKQSMRKLLVSDQESSFGGNNVVCTVDHSKRKYDETNFKGLDSSTFKKSKKSHEAIKLEESLNKVVDGYHRIQESRRKIQILDDVTAKDVYRTSTVGMNHRSNMAKSIKIPLQKRLPSKNSFCSNNRLLV